jgi:serine/threonine protein phosphatase 1
MLHSLRNEPSKPECRMRTLAIGDIHGCSKALRTLLDAVKPGRDDVLVTLGDYVDRGPDSKGVLDMLIGLETTTNLKPLLGNHEILFLDALNRRIDPEGWLRVGGAETIHSYSPDEPTLAWDKVSPQHVEFLSERCVRYFEDEKNLFVHANANAYFSLNDQSDDWLFWTRFDDSYPHISGKRMICGHTAQKSGWPNVKPHAICLDTWVYGQGWLTCMDVEAGIFVQANQAGAVRDFTLEELADPPTHNTVAIKLPAAPGS